MSRRARRAARAPVNSAPCPHPEKGRFTKAAATAEAVRLDPYPCVCGAWHLSRPAPLEQRIRAALRRA